MARKIGQKSREKQEEILEYIEKEVEEKGYPPSIRDICKAVKLSSTSSVAVHLGRLEEENLIRRGGAKSRAIVVTEKGKNYIRKAERGTDIPDKWWERKCGAVIVIDGDGLSPFGIRDKDLALVAMADEIRDGDCIAAVLDGKMYYGVYRSCTGIKELVSGDKVIYPEEEDTIQIVGKIVDVFPPRTGGEKEENSHE